MMKYYSLENSDKSFSNMALGCWQLSKKGWKDVNLIEASKTLHLAVESGITILDTAPIYGFGESEKIIGREIKNRDEIVISTKCGLIYENGKVFHCNKPDIVEKQIFQSLKNLKTNYIDVMFIHWPDPDTETEETIEKLLDLKRKNYIRHIGLSNFSKSEVENLIKQYPIDILQYKYNFLERDVEKDIFPAIKNNNIKFWAYSPLAQGLLTPSVNENYKFTKSDVRKLNPLFRSPLFEENLNKRKTLGNEIISQSLKFLTGNICVNSVIVGISKEKHLQENLINF